ncbi:Auxilin-related protein 2 [Vitis vinifera]|uniref:Auxilin-related protein 2 n=2 Tax=Vitis vinifera TaxID=29760 RepID=A0A438F555_VITVI|nr:Auxilin-related protein 2 [Vitis vinifera]
MVNNYRESGENLFDMPTDSTNSHKFVSQTASTLSYPNAGPNETNSQKFVSLHNQHVLHHLQDPLLQDQLWFQSQKQVLLVPQILEKRLASSLPSIIPLSIPELQVSPWCSEKLTRIDGFERFIMGRTQNNIEHEDVLSCGEMETNSAAAVMKEARGRAEAKFRHAEVARESENKNAARGREDVRLEKDEKSMEDAQERILREKQDRLGHEHQHREKEEQEREQQRHEEQRERECKEDREQRRLEKERERTREIEKEREKARRAVERATREAHETAASEFCLKAWRAAVEKANAEAREHAERAAVQRAQAEAPERAAAEAKERAEKAVADARERASVQAKEKEAWENAAAEARERTAATARVNQRKNENDFESFFSMSNRPSREPRPRASSSDPLFETHSQNRPGPEGARRTSLGSSSSMRKASSTTNVVDAFTSSFGGSLLVGNLSLSLSLSHTHTHTHTCMSLKELFLLRRLKIW